MGNTAGSVAEEPEPDDYADGPLDFLSQKKRCLENGVLFRDSEFPANATSIFNSNWTNKNIVWKRPMEIVSKPQFVADVLRPSQIIQGKLDNCWLLAAIASLVRFRRLLKRVVPMEESFEKDYAGIFCFRIWRFGQWTEVVIDDRLPTVDNKLFFMHSSSPNEFWCALLEKAFAKLFGSYRALECGSVATALEDLTGGLAETVELSRFRDSTWGLGQTMSRCNLMGCFIHRSDKDGETVVQQLENGLVTGHAYTITAVRQVKLRTLRSVTLVRVRNPWGDTEWTGDWSTKSEMWRLVPDADKGALGWRRDDDDDGEFWMSLEDFACEFTELVICHLSIDANSKEILEDTRQVLHKWTETAHHGCWKRGVNAGGCAINSTFWINPQYEFEIKEADEPDSPFGSVIVGLMQHDKEILGRNFAKNPYIGYSVYESGRASKNSLSKLSREYLESVEPVVTVTYKNDRETVGRHRLKPGKYVVVVTTYDAGEENKFFLRLFTKCHQSLALYDQRH